jgi:hypothetical protein
LCSAIRREKIGDIQRKCLERKRILGQKLLLYIFLLTLWFSGEGDPGNPEFGREVSKVWPRIVLNKKSNLGSPE